MKHSIGILGAGTWGCALARMLSLNGCDVAMWSALEKEIVSLNETRLNPNLPYMPLPEAIRFTVDMGEAMAGRDIVLFAVPSVFVRSTARAAAKHIEDGQIVIDVAKGIEPDTLKTMTEVIRDEFEKAGLGNVPLVALSGPTHAEEVARDLPTTIVSACTDMRVAERVQDVFMNTCLRVYTNTDVTGVELSGALKNIIALASGICSGLGYGDNARAALITRGLAEITRIGTAMGCAAQTFSGLAGIGDLIVTATSEHSRNNRCGRLIGQGVAPDEAIKQVGMVVEGVNAVPAALQLAKRCGASIPIISAVDEILRGVCPPGEAVRRLMSREKTGELSSAVVFENALLKSKREGGMKRVITYGTFDLLHYGHINLLRRAKALGDYLVVALSTDEFNWNMKQKKCYFTYEQRKALLESIRYVDLVIPEENWEQKKTDVHEYKIDTFVMGDDWTGKFDFLKEEGTEVVYLPRTPEISTTQIKKDLNKG